MSAAAEDTFRQVTFTAAAGPSGVHTPAEALLGYLRQPFNELRTGTYRHSLLHRYFSDTVTGVSSIGQGLVGVPTTWHDWV